MKKRIRDHIPTVVSVVATIVLLLITLVWFNDSIGRRVRDTNEAYLIDNTRSFASVFGTKLDDQIVMLESQSRYFEDVDMNDREAVKAAIMTTKGIGAFKTIGAADLSGYSVNYNGVSAENILPSYFFNSAMNGSTVISESMVPDEDGEKVLIVGVPIKHKGIAAGIIYGTFRSETLDSLINMDVNSKKEYHLLLDGNGDIIAVSDGFDYERMGIRNLFDDTGASKPAKKADTVTECVIGGTRSIVVVTMVGVHDWYYVSVLAKSSVDSQLSDIYRDVLVLVIIVVFAFIILFISIMYLLKSNSDILRANEKFKLVTVESQDMVFDYNFQKQTLVVDGNAENILPMDKSEFSRADVLSLISLIHDEDKDIRNRIRDVIDSDASTIKGEFRIRCTDGSYSWFRMKGTVVRGHDNHPQRFIGSLVNVDEQMNRDMRLFEKAETDNLTGIYNKTAFYDHVNEQLRSASDSDLFAIYIIDVDNFKAVNDDLGHTMGDQVLSDVAKKLCIVFSDMDYVGRIGGDEFAAFLHLPSKARNVGMNIIKGKAQAICTHISDTYKAKKKQVSITATVGVAIYPYSGRDYNNLFRNAGKALQKAKSEGKNRFAIYSPDEKY